MVDEPESDTSSVAPLMPLGTRTPYANFEKLKAELARDRSPFVVGPSVQIVSNGVTADFTLPAGRTTIGRGDTVDIRLHDDAISRCHAVFSRCDGEVFVEDAGSSNGTFVNGELVTSRHLGDGDRILLSESTRLVFRQGTRLELPLPIGVARRALATKSNATARFNAIVKLVDAVARYSFAIAASSFFSGSPVEPRDAASLVGDSLQRRVTLGHWLTMCHHLVKACTSRPGGVGALPIVGEFVNAKGKTTPALRELLDFVAVRNDFAHGRLSQEATRRACEEWLPRLQAAIEQLQFASSPLFVVTVIDFADVDGSAGYAYTVYDLIGDNPIVEPSRVAWLERIPRMRVHVRSRDSEHPPLCLEPFLIADEAGEGTPRLGFLDGISDGLPNYVDALDGDAFDLNASACQRHAEHLAAMGLASVADS